MTHTDPAGSTDEAHGGAFRLLFHALVCGGILLLAGSVAATPGLLAQGVDKPTEKTPSCTSARCHVAIVNREVTHGPAAGLECLTCHEYAAPEHHLFRLAVPKAELCSDCHQLTHEAVVHQPVAENDCIGCHDPHGSDQAMMLLKDPADGLCLTCHEGMIDKEFVHGPVAVQACVLCHAPHSSSNPGLLTTAPSRLCVDCHARMKPTGLEARHLHQPMEDGCSSCHDPHASDVRYQLHSTMPDLCTSCHDGVASDVAAADIVHEPVTADGGCADCHNPHFTLLPRLQRSPQPDLCLNCHNQEIETSDGRVLADMATLLEENPNHHGPIRDGSCTACHQPHAGQHDRLLHKEYPAEFYAPYEPERYDLCFSCHIADLVKDESGTGLTNFRDGDLNLHWLHVNQEKGRTCRACHEVHASQRPFHVREAVPFGSAGWMLEINYEKTEEGGACLPACHKKRTYDRSAAPASGGITGASPA